MYFLQRTPSWSAPKEGGKQPINQWIEELSQHGIQVFYLDGRDISTKETFLKKAAEAMKFPGYFGANWDAFDECITDLEWFPAQRYILVYDRHQVFAQADPEQWQILLGILSSAEEYWKTRNISLTILLN